MFSAATIQFKAIPGSVELNRNKILGLCEKAVKEKAHVIILPEMCTTGYIWADRSKIHSIAEPANGESFNIFSKFCNENNCYLSYGFAEKNNGEFYNSQNLIGPKGVLLKTYRKVHLFEADLTWANPGNRDFTYVDTGIGRIGLGICMDLNFDDFIIYHNKNNTKWLLFATNWLEEYIDVHSYWKMKLENFNGTVFFANTHGFEYNTEFCGRSGIYEAGNFIKTAPKTGNHILMTRHKNYS